MGPVEHNPPLEPAVPAAAAAVVGQVLRGIDYKETFTLQQAHESWNATREDGINDAGQPITAEQQRTTYPDGWFEKRAGEFTLRRPSLYDEMDIASRAQEIVKGRPVDIGTFRKALGMAVIEILVTAAPKWFELAKLAKSDTTPYLILHWYEAWTERFHDDV